MAPIPPGILASTPTAKELQQEVLLLAVSDRLKATEADLASLKALVTAKNAQLTRLEAENLRLKMTRTDKDLATQVEGLRKEVGQKDRALVDYRRQLDSFLENEKIILRRAASAEAKVVTVQETLVLMQRSRDAAQAETEAHDRARHEAVSQMVAEADKARKLGERLTELEKKTKIVIDNRNAKGQGSLKR